MTNSPNEPTPETEEFIKQMQARHLAQSLDDFSHYYHATGELSKFARTLERERDALKAECAKMREALGDAAFVFGEMDAVAWQEDSDWNGSNYASAADTVNKALTSSNAGADLLAKAQFAARLAEALRAAKRLRDGKYLPWSNAGGVNDCAHGYGEGIPCPKCDAATLDAALREFEQTTISPNQQNT